MKRALVILAAAAGVALAACATVKYYKIEELHFPNRSFKLKNGLRVAIQPEDTIPYVLVAVRYDVGAAFDPKEKKGLAHLVEHLAFRLDEKLVEAPVETSTNAGKTKKPGKEKADGEGKGKTELREINYLVRENAWTSMDETVYWKQVAPAHFEEVLGDFADQMGDFSARITDDVFATERDVVRNERRSSYETEPLDRVILDLYERFFPPEHPYQGHRIIGSHETIKAIEKSDVAEFLAAHYHPGNATLVVLGPVEPKATTVAIVNAFGDKPRREPSKLEVPELGKAGQRRETIVVPEANETMVTVVWPLPPEYSAENEAAKLLRDSGWFHYRLVTNRGWAYWVSSGVWEEQYGSLFVVRALLRDHDYVDRSLDKIFEIADLIDSTVKRKRDIESKRRRRVYAHIYRAESPRQRVETMLEYFSRFGHPVSWSRELGQLEAVGVDAVSEAGRFLEPEKAFVLVHTPVAENGDDRDDEEPKAGAGQYSKEAAEKASSTRLDHDERDRPPAVYRFTQPFEEFHQWALATTERWEKAREIELDNGLRCRLVQQGHLPILYATANFGGGQLAEPAGKHGIGAATLQNMRLSGRADRENQGKMGVWTYVDAGDEAIRYSKKVLSVYADMALDLFAEEIRAPTYSGRDLEDWRERQLQSLGEAERNVDVLGARGLWRARGMEQLSPITTKQTVENITLGAVMDFHERIAYPENTVLTVASDLPVDRIEALVRQHFGEWDATGRPPLDAASLVPEGKPATGAIITIDVPKSSQSKIIVGFDAPGWADWKEARLADGVAELLDERVERLRKAMGITYGVHSFAWSWKTRGFLGVSTKVDHDATDRALEVLLQAIDGFRSTPVTDDQVDFVRRDLMNDYAGFGHTVNSVAQTHAGLMRQGRPKDYYRQSVEWLATLTRADVQRAVDELLGSAPTLVVAGKEPRVPEERTGAFVRFTGERVRYTAAELLE